MISKLISGNGRARTLFPFVTSLTSNKRFQTTMPAILKEDLPETVTIIPTISELTKLGDFSNDIDVSLVGHLQSRYLVESISMMIYLSGQIHPRKEVQVILWS